MSSMREAWARTHENVGMTAGCDSEIGTHYHSTGPYLEAYAREMAWRENNRRVSNGEQYLLAANAALAHPVSRVWKGYWQNQKSLSHK